MLLEDKVVIITGASRGIGRAVALGCAREGANVVVNDLSGPGAVVEEIRALGRRAVPAEGDVADPDTGKRIVAVAVDAFGTIKCNVALPDRGEKTAGLHASSAPGALVKPDALIAGSRIGRRRQGTPRQ